MRSLTPSRWLATLSVLIVLVVAGCSRSGNSSGNGKQTTLAKQAPSTDTEPTPTSKPVITDAQRLLAELRSPNPQVQAKALERIESFVKSPDELIATFVKACDDPTCGRAGEYQPGAINSVREAAVVGLQKLGPAGQSALLNQALPKLRAGLSDRSEAVLEYTAYAIARLGPKAAPAAPELLKLAADPREFARTAALEALRGIGTPAALPLIENLLNKTTAVRIDTARALVWLRPIPPNYLSTLRKALDDDELLVRTGVISALAAMKEAAGPVVPDLIELLDDEELLRVGSPAGRNVPIVQYALEQIGAPAVDAVTKLLTAKSSRSRAVAALVLGQMGEVARPAVPKLQQATKDNFLNVSMAAAYALARLDVDPADSLKLITDQLKSSIPGAADFAVQLLNALGPKAAPAVPALAELLGMIEGNSKRDNLNRRILLRTIARTGAGAGQAVPTLAELLQRDNVDLRAEALAVLAELGPHAEPAAAQIGKLLDSPDRLERQRAAATLEKLGPAARPAIPAIAQQLQRADLSDDDTAELLDIVKAVGPGAAQAAPGVIKALDHKNREVSKRAVLALGRLGPAAKGGLEQLAKMAKSATFLDTQLAALQALAQLGPEAKSIAPALQAFANEPSGLRRVWASVALARINDVPRPALTILGEVLASKEIAPKRQALEALPLLGDAAVALMPQLRELVRGKVVAKAKGKTDSEQRLRLAAIATAGVLGHLAQPLVPDLLEALDDEDDLDLCTACIRALGQIGPAAREALPRLRQLQRSDNLGVLASQAVRAIEGMGVGKE